MGELVPLLHIFIILHIRVFKDIVDDIAYHSRPMGVPIDDGIPLSRFLEGDKAGQSGHICDGQVI